MNKLPNQSCHTKVTETKLIFIITFLSIFRCNNVAHDSLRCHFDVMVCFPEPRGESFFATAFIYRR